MSKITWKAEKRDIDSLKPHPKNPRNFTKKGLEDLDKSIEAIGMAQPININPDGTILSGHARVLKLKQKGIKEVEVYIPNRDLDEKEQEQVLVRMNANTAGEWDIDKLANEFELPDLAEWGLEIPDIELSLPQIETEGDDDIPESAPAITAKGDLYELGEHRVLCGDSTMIDEVEKVMDGKKADMVFTDPPYGVDYEKKTKEILGSKNYTKISNDDKKGEELKQFFKDVFSSYIVFLKDDASYYVCSPQGGDSEMMMMMMRECGMKCRHQIIWVKDAPVFSMGRLDYDYKHEPILYGWVKKHNFYRKGEQDKSVWEFSRKESKLHPTMKPISLVSNAIKNSSKQKDLIIDLFLGSGSTLIACEKTDRKCYGMELDEKYCDVIVKRYIDFCEKNGKSFSVKRNGEDCLEEFKRRNKDE